MSNEVLDTQIILDQPAKDRMKELKELYYQAKKEKDTVRMSQCVYMAKSIRAGKRGFIYDFLKKGVY